MAERLGMTGTLAFVEAAVQCIAENCCKLLSDFATKLINGVGDGRGGFADCCR